MQGKVTRMSETSQARGSRVTSVGALFAVLASGCGGTSVPADAGPSDAGLHADARPRDGATRADAADADAHEASCIVAHRPEVKFERHQLDTVYRNEGVG